MNMNRRKFINTSLLLGGSAVAGYTVAKSDVLKSSPLAIKEQMSQHATYQNTMHNRHYYRYARF